MLSFLPPWLLVFITLPLFFSITSIIGSLIFVFGVIKLLLPLPVLTAVVNFIINCLWRGWALFNLMAINLTNPVEWQIDSDGKFDKKGWYLLICNHISWLDIMVLTQVALNTLPSPKFFLKNELKKLPFVGMAAWAMDMPFMKRYSSSYLEKYPEKKGQDIETTRRSCEKFKNIPTTIINFVEGTRFTKEKHQDSQSSYQHLLPPKAGGIAFTLATMGHLFSGVVNVTLNYPDNKTPTKDILFGKLQRVQVQINLFEVSEEMTGDYFNDVEYKSSFQTWLNGIWEEKDQILAKMLSR